MGFLDKNGVERLWMHVLAKIGAKVDKVNGKGLSTNDFTDDYKNKLDGIEDSANNTVVDSTLDAASTNPVQNKVVHDAINELSDAVSDITPDSINAVKKTGDAMTGTLTVPYLAIKSGSGNMYPGAVFRASDQEQNSGQINFNANNRRFYVTEKCLDTDYSETYFLPTPDSLRTADASYQILTNKDVVSIPQGGTGVGTIPALMTVVNNSYNVNMIANTINLFTLAPGIYHCEDTTSTDCNYPIAEKRATIEIFGQYRPNTAAADGCCNGYWTIRVTYPSGKQFMNHRGWDKWSGWKVVYNSASIVCSDTEPTNPFTGQIWLKPI